MSSSDFSTPPSKKRKITTTYGSRSAISRAVQAVKDAVPGKLLFLANGARTEPKSDEKIADSAVSTKDQDGINAAVEDLDNSDYDHEHSKPRNKNERLESRENTPRSTRASKRSRSDIHESNEEYTKRKRRKATPSAKDIIEAELPTALGYEPPLFSTHDEKVAFGDEAQPKVNGRREEHITSEKGDASNSRHRNKGIDQNIPPSNGRLKRVTRRTSIIPPEPDIDIHATQDSSTLNTQPATPGRKRGRPRKHPITTPSRQEGEEDRLSIHRISPQEVNGVQNSKEPRTRRDRRKRKSGEHDISPAEQEVGYSASPYDIKHTLFKATVNKPAPPARDEDTIFDLPGEEQELSTICESLQKPTVKLRRVLEATPISSINSFKSGIMETLTGQRSMLVGMNEEYDKVHQLVMQTILAGEGNSMLVIGPRGSGKTSLVRSVLDEAQSEHANSFVVVPLSGLIQTDDKLALREIWRQLGREVAGEDDESGTRINYADALTSLLALLAHSSESSENDDDQDARARSVIFVIEEFHLFASHPRQTLLYNLFDVAQSRNAPIAVLGLTTRIDIVESLEKRVKSRFGQRYVYLTHPRTFDSFQDICKSVLSSHSMTARAQRRPFDEKTPHALKLRTAWNEYVEVLFNDDPRFHTFLRHLFVLHKGIAAFLSASLLPISLLTSTHIPDGASFIGQSLLPPDSKLQLLPSLSDLELSMIIAAARLDIILETDLCNFSMVHEEYMQLASRVKVQSSAAGQTAVGGGARVWGKDVAMGAWEKLIDLELIIPGSSGTRGYSGASMWKVDVALEEIGSSVPRMGSTMARWCREI
ncbi:MAG: hypothetical protein Q9174_004262 [Haloplaca sp. 1 TL-2023]